MKTPQPVFDFDAFRKDGPWFQVGDLVRARKRWIETVKSDADLAAIQAAKEAYRVEAAITMRLKIKQGATEAEASHYVLHLSTFMGRWQSYVPEERGEALEDETPAILDESALRAQAELLHERMTKVLLNFLADKSAHRPSLKCRESKVCPLCHASNPQVPSVDELMVKLRNER